MRKIYIQLFAEGDAAPAQTDTAAGQDGEVKSPADESGNAAEAAPEQNKEPVTERRDTPSPEPAEPAENRRDTNFDRERMERDMRELQRFYPSFSPEEEMRDPGFSRLLRAGATVRQAYEVSHLPEILHEAMSYAARRTAEKITSAAPVPVPVRENARSSVTPVQPVTGKHSGWTEREILAILNGKAKP